MVKANEHEHTRAVRAARRAIECRTAARDLARFSLRASAERMQRAAREYEEIVLRYARAAMYEVLQ